MRLETFDTGGPALADHNVARDFAIFCQSKDVRQKYYSQDVVQALVIATALLNEHGGSFAKTWGNGIPGHTLDSREMAKMVRGNTILEAFTRQLPESGAKLCDLIAQSPVVGYALDNFFDGNQLTRVERAQVFNRPSAPQNFPEDWDKSRDIRRQLTADIAKAYTPLLCDPEILKGTVVPARTYEHRIPYFDRTMVFKRKLRVLSKVGVAPNDELAGFVVGQSLLVSARSELINNLHEQLGNAFRVSKRWGSAPSTFTAPIEQYLDGHILNDRALTLQRIIRQSTFDVSALQARIAERTGMTADTDMEYFSALMFHRPSQMSGLNQTLSRVTSFWIYDHAVGAVVEGDSHKLNKMIGVLSVCGTNTLALMKYRSFIEGDETSPRPSTAALLLPIFAKDETVLTVLEGMAENPRKKLMQAMAGELASLIDNFELTKFPELVTPKSKEELFAELVERTEWLAEVFEKLEGTGRVLQRPQTDREILYAEAQEKMKDPTTHEEVLNLLVGEVGKYYHDPSKDDPRFDRHETIYVSRLAWLNSKKPTVYIQKYTDARSSRPDSKFNPWYLYLLIKNGHLEFVKLDTVQQRRYGVVPFRPGKKKDE